MSDHFFEIDPETRSLSEILERLWKELAVAADHIEHPWSHVSLATQTMDGPRQRILRLREAENRDRSLFFYTDVRSPKVEQIEVSSEVSGLMYDPSHHVQLSLTASAEIHHDDEIAEDHWQRTPLEGRRHYMGIRDPGARAAGPSTNLPDDFLTEELTEEESLEGKENFAVIILNVESMELLWLRKSGNLRAEFVRTSTGWESSWIEP
ncbi:MAG TPA: pyridoxamine 5'-phosphate oxidase family protein [Planctomicrobium sp.]|nr:pyridoxamine 5'-phosphate oxidase family protein [Planctomicrobium sp.]